MSFPWGGQIFEADFWLEPHMLMSVYGCLSSEAVYFLQRKILSSPAWRGGCVAVVLGAPSPHLCSPTWLIPEFATPPQFLLRINLFPAWSRGCGMRGVWPHQVGAGTLFSIICLSPIFHGTCASKG